MGPEEAYFWLVTQPDIFQISYNQDALPKVAKALWEWGNNCALWTFTGGLGAGKTTLIRSLCLHLGVADRVTSPTFALVNEYRTITEEVVYHMDWYRLSSAAEGFEAGLAELLETPEAICFVEWPQQAAELLPRRRIDVEIEDAGGDQRILLARRH